MTAQTTRSLLCSGGPLDGLELPFHWPLDDKIRLEFAGRNHRYVLEDAPKIHLGGTMRLTYRYEGPSPRVG